MCVFISMTLERRAFITRWIESLALFQAFFFFFRLKIFLIHWNSDSLPSHAPSRPQQALTCPPSISSAVAGFYISLSNHVLGPSGPEPPSVRPVTYEGISVFITSVKAAVPTPSPKPRRRAAASAPRLPGHNLCNRPEHTAWCTETLAGRPQRSGVTLPEAGHLESSGLSCFESWIMDRLGLKVDGCDVRQYVGNI